MILASKWKLPNTQTQYLFKNYIKALKIPTVQQKIKYRLGILNLLAGPSLFKEV